MIRKIFNLLMAITVSAMALPIVAPARAEFGVDPASFNAGSFQGDGIGLHAIFGEGATPDTRAGAHPFHAATSFALNTITPPQGGIVPEEALRDVVVELPPGFIGNPKAAPKCSVAALNQLSYCPNDTAVGIAEVGLVLAPFTGLPPGSIPGANTFYYLPVYNMVPSRGEPALLAFYNVNPSIPILIHLSLDPSRNYAINASVTNVSNLATTYFSRLAIWGVPAASSHDPWRGTSGEPLVGDGTGCMNNGYGEVNPTVPAADFGPVSKGKCPSELQPPQPFLANPASCDGQPARTVIHVDSWQRPGRLTAEGQPDLSDPNWRTAVAESPPTTGCAALRFGGPEAPASLSFQPQERSADVPSGYDVRLTLPYNENADGRANPTLRDTEVTLPEGVAVNPSSANGLAACTSEQIGLVTPVGTMPARFDGQPARCPDASKIGTVEIRSPLVDHTLEGSVYLAKQFDNPFRSLLAIYIVVEDAETGVIVKLPGRVDTNPQSGRISSTFKENPQLPFTELKLHFFGGPRASLINPPTCGAKTTTTVLTPWSAPDTPPVTTTDSFEIEGGPGGGPCPQSEAEAPNDPGFEAGSVVPIAGEHSDFVLKLSREDGSQRLQSLNVTLPPGLTGRLAGIPYCPQEAIERAEARTEPGEGALEQKSPSCPAQSRLGTVTVAAGAGPDPVQVQGTAYLAGPYKGAPVSMAIVTPAVAGPFDLGVVAVRAALRVDPETAQITALSDPIPTILQGIPLDVRRVAVHMDRPRFTLNPTSCDPMQIAGTAFALFSSAPLSNRFQVGGCRGLDFKPRLSLRLFGPTRRGANPRLRAVVRARPGEANIARAAVTLPHSEFLDQSHIRTICTRVQFAEGNGGGEKCPPGSVYGHARAFTPLLDHPLEGPVYLRANGGERQLPDMVAALKGPPSQPIEIDLVGFVDSVRGGIRNRFETAPDAPVSKFILDLAGGKKSLLENSTNICRGRHRATVKMDAHNGKVHDFNPLVRAQCGGKRARPSLRHRHGRGR